MIRQNIFTYKALLQAIVTVAISGGASLGALAHERTLNADIADFSWSNVSASPDDASLVFDVMGQIFATSITGGIAQRISEDGWAYEDAPRVSPDGRSIAFLSDAGDGYRNIWVADYDGKNRRQITHQQNEIFSYDWTRDSKGFIAAVLDKQGYRTNLIRVDLNTGSAGEVRKNLGVITDVSASRADDRIALTLLEEADWRTLRRASHVLILNSDGTLFEPPIPGYRGIISRDGSKIFYLSARTNGSELWVHILGKNESRRIADLSTRGQTDNPSGVLGYETYPSFSISADSKKIYVFQGGKITRVDVTTGRVSLIPIVAHAYRQLGDVQSGPLEVRGSATTLLAPRASAGRKKFVFSAAGSVWISQNGASRKISQADELGYSPDIDRAGTKIAYVSVQGQNADTIRVYNFYGEKITDIKDEGKIIENLRWSEDGKLLYYISSFPCRFNIKSFKALTSEEKCSNKPISIFEINILSHKRRELFAINGHIPSSLSFSLNNKGLTVSSYDSHSLAIYDVHDNFLHNSERIENSVQGVSQLIISPSGREVAFIARDAVWISQKDLFFSGTSLDDLIRYNKVRRLGFSGSSISWDRDGGLIWSVGRSIYTWDRHNGLQQASLNLPIIPPSLKKLAIINANIIPVSEDGIIYGGTILIEGGKIYRVSRSSVPIPRDYQTIDANGLFVVPGFIDTHAHVHQRQFKAGPYYVEKNEEYLREVRWGITTLLDPNSSAIDAGYQGDMVTARRVLGPRIFTSGEPIFGIYSNIPSWARSLEDLQWIVDQRSAQGVSFIKSYMIGPRSWRRAVVAQAHLMGLRVATEGGGRFDQQVSHVIDGVDGIEHNFPIADIESDVQELMASQRSTYTPVLVGSFGGAFGYNFFHSRYSDASLALFSSGGSSPSLQRFGREAFVSDDQQTLYSLARSVQRISGKGTRVTIGSHGELAGTAAHWDMWLLAMGGMSPAEVLRAATLSGAEKLGIQRDLGSIEVGKIADLVLLSENPLENIRATSNIEYVIQNGEIVSRKIGDYK